MKKKIKKTMAAMLALTIASGAMTIPAFAETTDEAVSKAAAIGYSSSLPIISGTDEEASKEEGSSRPTISGTGDEVSKEEGSSRPTISGTGEEVGREEDTLTGKISGEETGSASGNSSLQDSGIQPIVLEDGRVVWFRWSRRQGETSYQGYWFNGVKIAETKEQLAEWYEKQKNDASGNVNGSISSPTISGDGEETGRNEDTLTSGNENDSKDSNSPDSDYEETIRLIGPPRKPLPAPDDKITSSISIEENNAELSDDYDEEFNLNLMRLDETRALRKGSAVSDYLSCILATIGKSFYGETSFISLDEFIDAGEDVCVNENCNTSITLDFSDEGYKEKVTHHARNFYYENELYGVEVEFYGKSTAEGSLGDFIIESSTEKVAERRVYKNDEESTFLGEIKIESVIVPYSEMISGSDSLYEISIIISFNGIEMYSDDTIKELDGYILKKVLFTYEDNDIVIEDEGEENYCMVTESEVTYDEFMAMVENYENELGIRIN